MKLSYLKMRSGLSIMTGNEKFKKEYERITAKGESLMSSTFFDAIMKSGIDLDLLKELSGKDPDTIGPEEAVDIFTDFFTAIAKSWAKLQGLLKNLASPKENQETSTE